MAWSSLTAIFRRLFSKRSTSSTSDPALPVEVGAGEDFVRFILSHSQFASGRGRVKPQALMPMFNASKGRFETSTHRIAGLTDAQVWELGYSYVENPAEKRVVKASDIGRFETSRRRFGFEFRPQSSAASPPIIGRRAAAAPRALP